MPIREFIESVPNQAQSFLNKRIHIICIAVNGLTFYNAFAHAIGGMTQETAQKHCDVVNEKNETGTLYPQFNLTIIPISIFKDRNDFGNEELMKKHIADCFEAETKYIKSSNMIFVFEKNGAFDNELALRMLLENWYDTDLNVSYVPE